MEKIIKIKIEKLPEGMYLATSDEIQGLVAQGRTISETIDIARDVVKKLLEERFGDNDTINENFEIEGSLEYPLGYTTLPNHHGDYAGRYFTSYLKASRYIY